MTEPAISGRLLALLNQPGVTDLLLSGPHRTELDRGFGLEPVGNPFDSEAALAAEARRLIELGGRHLDIANPFADVGLAGGFRVHAVLKSACSDHTLLSIRKHPEEAFELSRLATEGMLGRAEAEYLLDAVKGKRNILISGATGTGKTTLLASLLAAAGGGRTLVLEDVPELARVLPGAIGLTTREANIEGKGEVSLSRLLREALRMRPDRILLGEVRGKEFALLLQALNTGHSGAGSTIHADGIADVPARLGALAQLAGVEARLANQLITGAIDLVVQLERVGSRRMLAAIARPALVGETLSLEVLNLGPAGALRLSAA